MSARDEYPKLAQLSAVIVPHGVDIEAADALDEIDQLRAEEEGYAAVFAEVAKVYDHLTGSLISKPNTAAVHVIAEVEARCVEFCCDPHATPAEREAARRALHVLHLRLPRRRRRIGRR